MIALIRRHFAQASAKLSDEDLSGEIQIQVDRAQLYRLSDEQSVATFVITAWLMGPLFDERVPALRQILEAPELSPASKAKAMADFTTVVLAKLDEAA